jgi:hypothetical protein
MLTDRKAAPNCVNFVARNHQIKPQNLAKRNFYFCPIFRHHGSSQKLNIDMISNYFIF